MRVDTLGFCLHVEDVPAATRFYADLLGFEVTLDLGWFVSLRRPEHAAVDLCVLHRDQAATPEVAGPVGGVVLALLVDDVDVEFERLTSAGVSFDVPPRDEPWGQRRCLARDPAGTGVELVEPTTPDPAWSASFRRHQPTPPDGGVHTLTGPGR